jgi:hypothetical protein
MNPRIEGKSHNATLSAVVKVNAAFLPGPRDFWFFKTSRLEDVPLNMNYGVLAHEFGHAAFDLAFAKKDVTFYEPNPNDADTSATAEEKATILSALNEGLADFFSWVVTGKLSEFGESLAILGKERVMPVAWTLSELDDNGDGTICTGGFYCEGSLYSSALYEISKVDGLSAIGVGKGVFAALGDLRDDWEASQKGESFDQSNIINRINARIDGGTNAKVCAIFKKWFDKDTVKEKITCTE